MKKTKKFTMLILILIMGLVLSAVRTPESSTPPIPDDCFFLLTLCECGSSPCNHTFGVHYRLNLGNWTYVAVSNGGWGIYIETETNDHVELYVTDNDDYQVYAAISTYYNGSGPTVCDDKYYQVTEGKQGSIECTY